MGFFCQTKMEWNNKVMLLLQALENDSPLKVIRPFWMSLLKGKAKTKRLCVGEATLVEYLINGHFSLVKSLWRVFAFFIVSPIVPTKKPTRFFFLIVPKIIIHWGGKCRRLTNRATKWVFWGSTQRGLHSHLLVKGSLWSDVKLIWKHCTPAHLYWPLMKSPIW